jgi:vacuolar-type H+-ATPase subunit F/Vma7
MLTPNIQLGIAAIGDEDLINGMRLAGISKYYIIEEIDQNVTENVREALSKLIAEPEIGIIIILEEYMRYISDFISHRKREKKTIPIIIDVPSKFGTKYEDITGYYEKVIKQSIGFDVRL